MKHVLLIGTLVGLTTIAAQASVLDNNTLTYENQRGSTLVLKGHKLTKNTGTITGTFTTNVASKNCQSVIGKPTPIKGYYDGNAITISKIFPKCGVAIATIGNLEKNKKLDMLWIVAFQGKQTETEDWNTRMIGHDIYSRKK